MPSVEEIRVVQENLKMMAKEDQEIRNKLMDLVKANPNEPNYPGADVVQNAMVKMAEMDRRNVKAVKSIIDRYGWPVISVFGEEADRNAWLLVQHADHDAAFQKRCLKLLNLALAKKDTSPENVAYLTDRVAVNEKRPQRFGTQGNLNKTSGCWELAPLEDSKRVDELRAQYDLPPLADYIRINNEFNGFSECNQKL